MWLEVGLLFELLGLSKENSLFQDLKIVVSLTTTVRFSRRKTQGEVLNKINLTSFELNKRYIFDIKLSFLSTRLPLYSLGK